MAGGMIYRSMRKVMNGPPPLMRIRRRCFLGFSQKRAFGAAAAAALPAVQYDYEEEEEEGSRTLLPIPPMEDIEEYSGCSLIGSPGPKKHLYAERLSTYLHGYSTLVRQELNPRSSLYAQIADAIVNLARKGSSRGCYNLWIIIVKEAAAAAAGKKKKKGGIPEVKLASFWMDFPKLKPKLGFQPLQEILDEIADIDLVVCLVNKHLISGICSHATELASSDKEDVRKDKLWVYAEQRKALEDYYKKQKKLLDFQVAGGPGETWQGLLAALHLKHMNAIHSSHLVT